MTDSRMHGDFLRTRQAPAMPFWDKDSENPCPPLNQSEFEALKRSIRENGYMASWPVVRSAGPACEGHLIDGFHRSAACEELGIEPVTVYQRCESEAHFQILQIRANLDRRQLSDYTRAVLGNRLLPLEQQRAAERRQANLKQGAVLPEQANLPERTEQGQARDKVAEEVGLKGRTFDKMRAIINSGDVTLNEALQTNDNTPQRMSVDRAYKELRAWQTAQENGLDAPTYAEYKQWNETTTAAVKQENERYKELAEAIECAPDFTCTCDAEDSFDCTCPLPEATTDTQDAARRRLLDEVIRKTLELDQLIQRNAIKPTEVIEYKARPHTFTGAAWRVAEFINEL